jgi:polar amino acid transport system substrate-binding protein
MSKLFKLASLVAVAAMILSACGGGGTKADNLLDDIKQRGYILVSTDVNYEPQSFLNTTGKRPSDTKCPADALTGAEVQGFDIDVAKAIGTGLGVETCFATPSWDAITAGNWANKWDVSVGSMTINVARQQVLDFSTPYYYTPAVIAVKADSGFTSIDEMAGKALCAGTATTYDYWLNNDMDNLGLPASSIYSKVPDGVTVVTLETDQECAQALEAGREDFVGYVTSSTVVDANIAAGMGVMKLGAPVYSEELAAAFDKASTLPTDSLLTAVNAVIARMHEDGTLSALSTQWFGMDLTQNPNQ